MKHLFYTHHLSWHRFLMLIGFLVLWQGIGWAASYFVFTDGGFTYRIYPTEGYATITDYPRTEIVYFPSEVKQNDRKTYPIKSFEGCTERNDVTRDFYFTSCYANLSTTDWGKEVTAHVPDSLFDEIISYHYNYGKITDGKRIAYHRSLYTVPLQYDSYSYESYYPESYYDVNGDGKMEFFGRTSRDSKSNFQVSTTNGEILKDESGFESGYMGMYDKDGLPLIVGNPYPYSILLYSYAQSNVIYKSEKSGYYQVTIADINGDGQKEIFAEKYYKNQTGTLADEDGDIDFYRMTQDGTIVPDKFHVTTDTTVVQSAILDDYTPNSGRVEGGNSSTIGSLSQGMFVKAKPAPNWTDWQEYDNVNEAKSALTNHHAIAAHTMPASTGYRIAADLNGDGLIDLQDGSSIYYNLGNNTFFKSPHQGSIYSADLTGNGLLDFIDFGNKQVDLYLNMADNGEMQMKTLLKNTAISNTFFGDFDKDGDVDILFVIPQSDYTIFQFYRNDGNGVFKPKDIDCDGTYTCIACNDYDGDGLYEILAHPGDSSEKNVLIKLNKNWTVSETKLPNNVIAIGDFNNDGNMKLVYSGNKIYNTSYTAYYDVPNSKVNSRPEKIEKPSAVQFADAGKLKISWKRGKDAETSACDLTYELRIGSESGKGDIYFGRANADGTRRVIEDGNMGRSLKYLFDTNNISEGKYYIAVQAVDACGLGGPWSDELVYDHKIATPVISKLPAGFCVADTIDVTVQNPNRTATYEWNISNGYVISQNENGSMIKAVFEKAGEQSIAVSMTQRGKTYQSESAKITLAPFRYAELPTSNDGTISSTTYLDLNQNGDVAVYSDGFYENKNGIYNKVRRTWNSDLSGSSFFITDFNHDGYPDFYLSGQDKGNVFTNSGEGDGTYEYDTEDFTFDGSSYLSSNYANIDLNNDGKLNLIYYNGGSLYLNKGDERTFISKGNNRDVYSRSFAGVYDFNRDGNIDLWGNYDFWENYTDKKYQTEVYLKRSGEEFAYDSPAVFYENSKKYYMEGFADFNNDGYADGYFFDKAEESSYHSLIIVKGKPMEEWPCKQTIVIPLPGLTRIYNTRIIDFDNNGYLDILVNDKLVLMDKDFSYKYITNVGKEYGLDTWDYPDEYHWQPLTPGAYPNGYKSNIKNEAPSAPTNVTATSVSNGLLLKWDDATDDHTPWMQMRYNVSLKIKGKTGANSFVLSPLNGLSDDAAICSGVYYRKTNQLIVPEEALTNGTTYELQVQAIDLMGEHSPMTKPVEVTYNAEKVILMDEPPVRLTGWNYYFKYANATDKNFTIDPGEGGKVGYYRSDSGTFSLSWNTPGTKTITIKDVNETLTAMVDVKQKPDLSIDLPERIMLNTPLTVKVPEHFATGKYYDFGFKESEAYKVEFEKGDSIATITFKEVGVQSLIPYLKIDNVNTLEQKLKANVIDEIMPTAEIKSVESDDKYYHVNWNTELPSEVTKVEISRETKRVNQFEVLDIVSVADGTFVDLTSDNRVQPQRYRIRLIADNGMQYSDYSTPHNPLHVMINKTADQKGNNLMWNAYEGLDVDSYVILRGSSTKNLKAIATIAGSQQNYTDYDALEGVSYYAVKFETSVAAGAKGMSRNETSEDVSSNIISSEEAMPTTEASNIYAGTVENIAKLTTDQQELHMVAMILPTYATFNKVNWSIVSGGEYASISQSGLLTAKGGKGDVVVRVVTLDGSNLSDEITIPCDVNVLAQDIDVRAAKKSVEVGSYLLLNAVLTPKNTTMSEVTWKSENTDVATVDENGILKAISAGVVKVTATTKDGSNLSAFINITVTDTTGISYVKADENNENVIYYDLEGRKIKAPSKGHIYITNKGQKIAF